MESKYGLVDRGEEFVDFVRETAGDDVGDLVADEVDAARRPNGTLDSDLLPREKRGNGPTHLLRSILYVNQVQFEVWVDPGFGVFERKNARATAIRILEAEGHDAAVDWVLANATKGAPSLGLLRDLWPRRPYSQPSEDFYRSEVVRLSRAWK